MPQLLPVLPLSNLASSTSSILPYTAPIASTIASPKRICALTRCSAYSSSKCQKSQVTYKAHRKIRTLQLAEIKLSQDKESVAPLLSGCADLDGSSWRTTWRKRRWWRWRGWLVRAVIQADVGWRDRAIWELGIWEGWASREGDAVRRCTRMRMRRGACISTRVWRGLGYGASLNWFSHGKKLTRPTTE